jgi:hypothetical protein
MIAVVLAVTFAASVAAAQGPATIDPGMTRAQVVAKLGEPLSSRSYDGHTYLLYKNGCERPCGMDDLVVLDNDKVVDAIFRSRARHYSGTSSSPRMIPASEARRGPEKADAAKPMKVEKPAKVEKKPAKPESATDKLAKIENAGAPGPKPTAVDKPAAVQPKAAPSKASMPQVIRPAPAAPKKPDDVKKPDTTKKAAPPTKKPS